MKRWIGLTVFLLILGLSWLGTDLWRRHQLVYGYDLIRQGDPTEKVAWLLGRPEEVKKAEGQAKDGKEYSYRSILPFRETDEWAIGFDSGGRVIYKYHFKYN